ncbi:transposase IS200 family protein [Arcicella aurantiaca]|uniref:Transposase IS200 family protein n=1 Tax=Arcicella aurantiaca TaxID=591202 RepID=A0A316EAH0_9BACT|nr:transposase [Arcicella aurantiaca]PWK26652.1 transposase IS200 family protein [Arcicella aurantiaca]
MNNFKPFYRRNLPHFQQNGATYFITTRLYGSLPKDVIIKISKDNAEKISAIKLSNKNDSEKELLIDEQHRRYFGLFDKYLESNPNGNHWLKNENVAKIIMDALHFRDGKQYELICYTIMSNHIHLVFTVLNEDINLYTILQRLKQFTASQANKILNKTGSFWQEESYDRVVRNEGELTRIISYVLNNPVKIGLVENWRDYPFSYVNQMFSEQL